MTLLNYNKYIIKESLTPEEIEERKRKALESHMRMYLSKDLSDVLKRIDHPISAELLTISRKNVKFDISFMDSTKEPGIVSYIQTNRVRRMEENGLDLKTARNNYNSELWTSNMRVKSSINKIIRKILPQFKLPEIETFGNEYRAIIEDKQNRMRIVYGDEILKWYLESNYDNPKSTLGTSCMRHRSKNKFMNFYAKNTPNEDAHSHVGMLILLSDNDLLLGRAIVWFNSIKPEPGRIFMDRIYYSNEPDKQTFINYAKERNWLYKQDQTFNNDNYIDPKDNRSHTLSLTFRLKNIEHDYYPYMDTLRFYTPDSGRISNKQNRNKKLTTYQLNDTEGGRRQV